MSVQRLLAFVAICAFVQTGTAVTRFSDRIGGGSCNSNEFQCKNDQCISSESLCDGLPDCRDGSDETAEECDGPNSPECNPRTFRCDYGACVDGDASCNGIKDCADNSDETLLRCQNGPRRNATYGNRCRADDQFRCNGGQCIAFTELCDGNIDCPDRSDEIAETCGSFNCPQYVFRCAYGACIDQSLKCNGQVNCADGSDEYPILCNNKNNIPTTSSQRPPTHTQRPSDNPYMTDVPRPTPSRPIIPYPSTRPTQQRPTQRPTQTTRPSGDREVCILPPHPQNGRWQFKLGQCSKDYGDCREGDPVQPGSQLVYACDKGYKVNGTADVFCVFPGQWSSEPKCIEIRCPALSSASVEAQCTDREGDWVSCDSPVLPGVKANLKCRNSYSQDNTDVLRAAQVSCTSRGAWDPKPIKCVPVCGITPAKGGVPLIVNGTLASIADFPWHATLYRQQGSEKRFICGATIIRDNLLVTAAHCVYDEVTRSIENPSKFYVAAGNIFKDYNYEFHDIKQVKKAHVKKIFISCNYLGRSGNYASDIAILQISKAFTFSAFLMPICLDTFSLSDHSVLEAGNYGKVAGFGRTFSGESSFVLQTLTVPYVPLNTCKASTEASNNQNLITIDKFCAGYTNGSSVCDGDSGGGLVFETDKHWYLRGIVSVGIGFKQLGAQRVCNSDTYSIYTRVSSHMEWMQDIILRLETNKPIRLCD